MSSWKYQRKKIIYFLGTDGSGKTTLSKNLIETLMNEKIRVKYFYARHFPVFLYPFKFFAKKTVMRNTNEFGNYSEYKKRNSLFFRVIS